VGLGATAEIADRHSRYVDLEYSSGKRFNKRQVNFGYRYSF
jgi:outer membrane autotransporter barrel domain